MAFPIAPNVGDQYTNSSGALYEFQAPNVWTNISTGPKLKTQTLTEDVTISNGGYDLTIESLTAGAVNGVIIENVSIQLPSQIYAVTGESLELFFNSMISTPNYKKFHFTCTYTDPTTGKQVPIRYFTTAPTVAGNYVLTVSVYDDTQNKVAEDTSLILVAVALSNPTSMINVWDIGDSLTADTQGSDELNRRLTGTGGTPAGNGFTNFFVHVEGNAGKEWNWYVSNEASPFVYSGVLDFEQYRIDNGLNVPTIANILLTWNGVGGEHNDAFWDAWDDDVYTFLTAFKAAFPLVKVMLMSPPMPSTIGGLSFDEGAQGLSGLSDEFVAKTTALRQALIYERISTEAVYSTYVEHNQTALQVDSEYNMPFANTPVNTRNGTLTERTGTNGVHPAASGYLQIGDAYYRPLIYKYASNEVISFISTWDTTTTSELVTLPYTATGVYSGTIDWGDGTVVANSYANRSHTYAAIDTHTVTIDGTVTEFDFNSVGDKLKIKGISQFSNEQSFNVLSFNGCTNLDITATQTINVIDSNSLFRDCTSLVANASFKVDVSQVFSQAHFLRNTTLLNFNILNDNPSQNENLSNFLLGNTIFDQPLNGKDVSNVTAFSAAFFNTNYNQPLDSWDTSKGVGFVNTFGNNLSFNQPLDSWDFNSASSLQSFMIGKSSVNYNAAYYDALLIKWDSGPLNGGLDTVTYPSILIGMGTIKHTAAGSAARASLVSKGCVITDGGLV